MIIREQSIAHSQAACAAGCDCTHRWYCGARSRQDIMMLCYKYLQSKPTSCYSLIVQPSPHTNNNTVKPTKTSNCCQTHSQEPLPIATLPLLLQLPAANNSFVVTKGSPQASVMPHITHHHWRCTVHSTLQLGILLVLLREASILLLHHGRCTCRCSHSILPKCHTTIHHNPRKHLTPKPHTTTTTILNRHEPRPLEQPCPVTHSSAKTPATAAAACAVHKMSDKIASYLRQRCSPNTLPVTPS
jgi:hypothetical protein